MVLVAQEINIMKYEDIINVYNLVLPMSDDEFTTFIRTDEYGNENPIESHILALLDKIKDDSSFSRHEKIIYKVLSEIKKGSEMKTEQGKKSFNFSYDIGDVVYHKATGHKCIVTGHLVDRREVMYAVAFSPIDRATVYSIEITDEEPIFGTDEGI